MKGHEMTIADHNRMNHEMLKWQGTGWCVGKPITKQSLNATQKKTIKSDSKKPLHSKQ